MTVEERPVYRAAEGASWLVVGITARLPFLPSRRVFVPLDRLQWRACDGDDAGQCAKPELARELIASVAARYPSRTLQVVMDSRYASRGVSELPDNVTVTLRMRANAVIQTAPPPRTGRRGRPRQRGDRLGTLTEIAEAGGFTRVATAAGPFEVKQVVAQWYPVFGDQPVRVVLARRPDSLRGVDLAIVSSDLTASMAELVDRCL